MNELIESYIKENVTFECDKKYISSVQVELNDRNDKMTILQCFDSIMVYINDNYIATFFEGYDRQGSKIWKVSSNLD